MLVFKWVTIFLWIVIAAILHLFDNNWGTFAVLIASLILPALSGVILFFAARALQFQLTLPDSCIKGEEIYGKFTIKRNFFAFLCKISCTLICENRFTGETDTFAFENAKIGETPFTIQAANCGILQLCLKNFIMTDPFGLFSRRVKFSTGQKILQIENFTAEKFIIIPPTGFALNFPITSTNSLDNDEYSTSKAGMDVSETFAIREYIPGDPIRSIHWKLSEKLDKTMVREFGLPIGSSVLLVLDTAPEVDVSPAGWDATAELFFSANLALLNNGIRTTVSWQSAENGGFIRQELRTIEDAAMAMQECLLTVEKNGAAFEHRFSLYEQVLLVTPGDIPEINAL